MTWRGGTEKTRQLIDEQSGDQAPALRTIKTMPVTIRSFDLLNDNMLFFLIC